jgi:predicted ABC-type transport system involved in lysophospholipase L1 biosynthesis ATPase subunit
MLCVSRPQGATKHTTFVTASAGGVGAAGRVTSDEGRVVLLELDGVVKHYRRAAEDVVALDGVHLAVDEGQAVALVGPSGSGKSTLLHLAGGLDVPDAGTVRLDGRDIGALSRRERARLRRRDVGFVFQFFHLLPSLSVAENVELPLLLDGAGRRGDRQKPADRVHDLLDRVGIGHRARHLPGELSGGEMQRAAIARALVARPRLVLADEPTGNLDSVTGRGVLDQLLAMVADDGTALVMVTHDEAAAARAGRVLHLRDGHLREAGDAGGAGDAGNGAGDEAPAGPDGEALGDEAASEAAEQLR